MSMIEVRNHKGDVVATFPSNYTFHFTVSTPAIRRGLLPKPPVPKFSVRGWLEYVGATPSGEVEDRKKRDHLYTSYKQFAGLRAVSAQKFYAALREEGYPDGKAVDRYFGMQLTNVTSKLG